MDAESERDAAANHAAGEGGVSESAEAPSKVLPMVRIMSGRSKIAPASGAIVKQLEGSAKIMVTARDDAALWLALCTLLAARRMLAKNECHMPVFQPFQLTKPRATMPHIPVGAYVLFVSKILAGDVTTDNSLVVGKATDPSAAAAAIVARLRKHAHTVVECVGPLASVKAMQAIIEARNRIHAQHRDLAVILDPQLMKSRTTDVGEVTLNRFIVVNCMMDTPTQVIMEASKKRRT